MSNYPGQLDTNAELAPVADNASEIMAETINALRAAIFAIESTLGVNPQGVAADLVTRLEQILNPDGTFKSDALVASGLIALPITNSMVGSAAAIAESKLNLDIPTTSLQSQISSNDIDIVTLQNLYNTLSVHLANHTSGINQRHDGYHIDIAGGMAQAPLVTTVGKALDFIYEQLQLHKGATAQDQHPASAISYTPDPEGPFTADNVQDAITQIDTAFQEDRRRHNDSAHGNGVVHDGYSAYGGQIGSPSAALRTSRYQPTSGQDQIKMGHINASSVKTRGLDTLALSATAQNLDFTVRIGTSTRTLSVTGLHTAQYPATNGRFPVKALVEHLNAAFANVAALFPLQAYDAGDGEIIVQHNIARSDCTVMVESPALNSAVSAFGFSAIAGIESPYVNVTQLYLDGYQISSLKVIHTGTLTISPSSSVISLGTLVGTGGLNLKSGNLIHIFNHTTSSASGTYSISAVGAPPSTQINLTTTVDAGTFDYIIYEDTANLGTSSNPRSVDVIYNSDQTVQISNRYEVTLAPISGVEILEVSDGISPGSGLLQLVTSTTNTLQLTINALSGPITSFPSGYVGMVTVYAHDDINYITCLISSSVLSSLTSSVIIYESAITDQQIKVASTYFNGGLVVSLPIDKIVHGTIDLNSLSDSVIESTIEAQQHLVIGSGVLAGLSASTASATQISVDGGSAFVGGRRIEVGASTINVFNRASATGTWNLTIDKNGNFEIFDDTSPGYAINDIADSRDRILVAQFTTLSGSITSTSDARVFINHISEKYIPTINQLQESRGTFASITSAALYASYGASATAAKMIATSDISAAAISISSGSEIECLSNATFTTLTIETGAALYVSGTLTATSITMQSGSKLVVEGGVTLTGSISVASNCFISLNGVSSLASMTVSGSGNTIIGLSQSAEVQFSGAINPAVLISDGYNTLSDITLSAPNTPAISVVRFAGSATRNIVSGCNIRRLGALGSWLTGMYGIEYLNTAGTNNPIVSRCTFDNFEVCVYLASTAVEMHRAEIRDSIFSNSYSGILARRTNSTDICSNHMYQLFDLYVDLKPAGVVSNIGTSIYDNTFSEQYSGGEGVVIRVGPESEATAFDGNLIRNIVCADHLLSFQSSLSSFTISNNRIYECTTPFGTKFAMRCSSLSPTGASAVSGNIIADHIGALISATNNVSVTGNSFASQSAEGTPYVSVSFSASSGMPACIANGNIFEMSSDQTILMEGARLSENFIETGSIEVLFTDVPSRIADSYIDLTLSSAASAINVGLSAPTEDHIVEIKNNTIRSQSTTAALQLQADTGSIFVIGNTFIPRTSVPSIIATSSGTGHITMNGNYIVIVDAIAISQHISIDSDNTHVIGNTLRSSGTHPTTASIVIGATSNNISILDNILDQTAAPGARLINSTSTQDVLIDSNKNAQMTYMLSALDGASYSSSTGALSTSEWSVDLAGRYIKSAGTSSGLAVPINNLPIGSKIISCTLHASSPTNGSITVQLWARDTGTGLTAQAVSPSAASAGTGTLQVTATANSLQHVSSTREYFVTILSTAVGNLIGNIAVNIYN